MVTSLSDYSDVLYFHPKVPKGYFRAGYEKQAVLVPMKACKVLVPYPKDDALNLFQETILKLLNCGAKEEKWLAEKLALDISLVEVVIKELYERKLITKSRNITEEGIRFLEDDSLSYDMKTGYIFYDYISKSYMDAFVPDAKYKPAEIRSRKKDVGIIEFVFDSTDPNSRYESAIVVNHDKPETDIKPTTYDALKVCRKQKNRERMLFAGANTETRDEDVARFAHSDKVTVLGDNKDVYVATYLVIPTGDIVNKSRMQALYPFGEGFSLQIIEPLLASARYPENEFLEKAIEELKKRQTGLTENEKRNVRMYSEDAIHRIDDIFSANIQNYPYINKRALEVESKRESILRLMKENKGKNWEIINSSINDYILAVYRVLGAALIEVANRNDYYVDILNSNQSHNSSTLTEIALKCGFVDDNMFRKYFRVKKGRVTGGYGSEGAKTSEEVCALIALNLLEAKDNMQHPFYELAQKEPGFICESVNLTHLRDEGMHGNDIEYNFRHVEGLGKVFFKAISIMMKDLSFDERKFELDEAIVVDENVLRHRKAAENEVERIFTRGINRYVGLNNKLVEMIEEQAYGEERLKDTNKNVFEKSGESYPTYVSEVLEFIIKELCQYRINKNALSGLEGYSEEYGKRLLKEMKDAGFNVNTIPYYSLPNISKSFDNFRMGTLQSNFYVWYFSEKEQPDNMITEVAMTIPNLVQIISDVVEIRQHKGLMEYGDESLTLIKSELNETLNKLIDLMIQRGLY